MLSLDTRHDTPDSYNYHDNGNVVPDLLLCIPVMHVMTLVMIPVMTLVMTSYDPAHSRNLIIMLISHKKDNLYGEWEEVMDAGMIPCL